jgi:acyl-CoA thioester hydrolase
MIENTTRIRVRYADTDQMGFAYYARYLEWFEVGRTEMLRALGLPYAEIEKQKIALPVLEVYCKYRKPA